MPRERRRFTGAEIELVELLWEDMAPFCTERYIARVLKCRRETAHTLIEVLRLPRYERGRRRGARQSDLYHTEHELACLENLRVLLEIVPGVSVQKIEGPNVHFLCLNFIVYEKLIEVLDVPYDDDPGSLWSSFWHLSSEWPLSVSLEDVPCQVVAPYDPILVSLYYRLTS